MYFNEYEKIISKYETLKLKIKLDHYSYVIYDQVSFKSKFYNAPNKLKLFNEWQYDKNTKIFGCDVFPFKDKHSEIINKYYKKLI
jgi:hypothetical protein